MSKRDFHQNHFALTKTLVERYAIAVGPDHGSLEDYLTRLEAAPEQLRRAAVLLIVIGFLLDGQISWRERRRIRELAERGVFRYTVAEVRVMCRDFVRGAGIEALLTRQLAPA